MLKRVVQIQNMRALLKITLGGSPPPRNTMPKTMGGCYGNGQSQAMHLVNKSKKSKNKYL